MLLWVTLAFAARVSEKQMQRWLVELVPAVEAAAGRRFVERPELVLDDRARVEKLLLDNAVRFERFAPGSMPTAPTIDPGIIALYSLNTQRVYVVTESVLSIFERVVDDTALLEPFVRCAIAHELTHALQHQHGLMALDAGATRRWKP